MFLHVFRLYSEFLSKGGVKNIIENNILLEDFLIHARILYEFFYLSKKNKDNVLAKHFLTESAYKRFKKYRTKKILIDKIFPWKKANKRLAHLTYYRLREKSPTTKVWPVGQIYAAIYTTMEAFILNTDDIIKKELFKEYGMENIVKEIFEKRIINK